MRERGKNAHISTSDTQLNGVALAEPRFVNLTFGKTTFKAIPIIADKIKPTTTGRTP